MRQSLKISISLLLSLIIAFLFLVFGASGLFTIIETNFYIPRIRKHYTELLQRIDKEIEKNTEETINRFKGILDNPYIPTAFLTNQGKSLEDIRARERDFASLKTDFPDLLYVRFIGTRGKKIYFSTRDKDEKQVRANQRVYYNYDQVDPDTDINKIISTQNDPPKVYINAKNNLLIYSFPVIDSYDVFKGTALFYVSKENIIRKLLLSPEFEIKDDIILIEDKGVLLNFPGELYSLIEEEVKNIWEKNREKTEFSDILSTENEDILNKNDNWGSTAVEHSTTYTFLARKTKYSGFLSLLLPGEIFEIPQLYKTIMLILLFFTMYIVIYILFNIKQDPLLVISRRIKYLQIQFLKQFMDAQEKIEWKKWHIDLQTRESEIKNQIKKGVGKIKNEKEVNELINKSWKNILSIISKKAEQAKTVSLDVNTIEEAITRAFKRGNIVIPVRKSQDLTELKEDTEAGFKSEEKVKTLEQAEEIEEVEEIKTLEEEIEEVDEIEALEEVEEADKVDEIEALEKVEEADKIDEIECLEEVDEIKAIEEVGEENRVDEIEALEEIEEAEGIEDYESPELVEEAEVASDLEVLEEEEEIEEAELEEALEGEEQVVLISTSHKQKDGKIPDYTDKETIKSFFKPLPKEPIEQLEELELAASPDEYTYDERGGKYYLLRKELLKDDGKNGTGKQEQSGSIIFFEPLKKTKEDTQKIEIPSTASEPELKYKTEQEEYHARVNKNQIRLYTLEEIFTIMQESDENIVMENGVYKISKDVMKADLTPKDSELKELVDSVKDGVDTIRSGGEKVRIIKETLNNIDPEEKKVPFTFSSGIDYDNYLSKLKRQDKLSIMKSLVEFSKDLNAFVTAILIPSGSEYVIDISVGLQEKSRELFKFSKEEIYSSEIFSRRKVCIIYIPLRELQFLRERLDELDKKYINSVLFIPAKFKQNDSYFLFGFSNKIKGSIKDIVSNLRLRFVL